MAQKVPVYPDKRQRGSCLRDGGRASDIVGSMATAKYRSVWTGVPGNERRRTVVRARPIPDVPPKMTSTTVETTSPIYSWCLHPCSNSGEQRSRTRSRGAAG